MRALLLGSGGRESALAAALVRSRSLSELVAAPGNPGIARTAAVESVDIASPAEVVALARRVVPDLVVVGPEAPLVAGVGDALRTSGFDVFGPDREAARIEASKEHSKRLMDGARVPTARWEAHTSLEKAVAFLDELGPPYVVKADGLAAGKGVVVTVDRDEAIGALEDCLERGRFGDAGKRVVVEEFLDGEEVSLIAFTDGRSVIACEPARDYKRARDGDRGPNTGGMGSLSPPPDCPKEAVERITAEVVEPMVRATAALGHPFVGAIYAGLALSPDGPRVLEFNARFGDPEAQALLPRLTSDLAEHCRACATGELAGEQITWADEVSVCVVLASGGYPGPHTTGHAIEGIEDAASLPGVEVFHAGTSLVDGRVVTAGGRVLAVTALGASFEEARARAYGAADRIHFEGKHLRTDIASGLQPARGPEQA